jgi:hypothetical protein
MILKPMASKSICGSSAGPEGNMACQNNWPMKSILNLMSETLRTVVGNPAVGCP